MKKILAVSTIAVVTALTGCSNKKHYLIDVTSVEGCGKEYPAHYQRNLNCSMEATFRETNAVLKGTIASEKGAQNPLYIWCDLEKNWCDNWAFEYKGDKTDQQYQYLISQERLFKEKYPSAIK